MATTPTFCDLDAIGIVDKLQKGLNINDVLKLVQSKSDSVTKYKTADGKLVFSKKLTQKQALHQSHLQNFMKQ